MPEMPPPTLGSDGAFHWTDPDGSAQSGPLPPRTQADVDGQKATAARNDAVDAFDKATERFGPDSSQARDAAQKVQETYEAQLHADAVSDEMRRRYPQTML